MKKQLRLIVTSREDPAAGVKATSRKTNQRLLPATHKSWDHECTVEDSTVEVACLFPDLVHFEL